MTDELVANANVERRVRRLEDAHASMDKSLSGLGTQLALAEQEQRHTRELMDARFSGVEGTLGLVSSKVDTLTGLIQSQSTDPQASILNREVEKRLAGLETTSEAHHNIIQQGIGASRVFRVVALGLGAFGSLMGGLNFLRLMGVFH